MRIFVTIILVLVSGLQGCTSENDELSLEGTILSVSDISGNWNASTAQFSRAAAGPVLEVDIVEDGGVVTLLIQTTGRFTLTVTPAGSSADVTTGMVGFDEDLLVVVFDDTPDDFVFYSIDLTGDVLTLQGPAEYDFSGDGSAEQAVLSLMLSRQ